MRQYNIATHTSLPVEGIPLVQLLTWSTQIEMARNQAYLDKLAGAGAARRPRRR